MSAEDNLNPNFVYEETDERVWREELDSFIPAKVFDFHGHVYRREFLPAEKTEESGNPSTPKVVEEYPREAFKAVERRLWPGREFKALVFGSVSPKADLPAVNAYATETAREYGWEALAVAPPTADAEELSRRVRAGGFLGLKPYWTFVTHKAQNDVTIEDMIPPAMREAADRNRWIITLHIPRAGRLADPLNITGLQRLCREAPRAKIVLAHFGRAYFPEALGEAHALAELENLYPETSMVQDWEVYEFIFKTFDRRKILFGLDLPVAQEKGKLLSVNGQRHFFTKRAHRWSAHVEPGAYEVHCTLFAYEMAKAAKKAAERVGLSAAEIKDYFWNNAARLVESVKASAGGATGG